MVPVLQTPLSVSWCCLSPWALLGLQLRRAVWCNILWWTQYNCSYAVYWRTFKTYFSCYWKVFTVPESPLSGWTTLSTFLLNVLFFLFVRLTMPRTLWLWVGYPCCSKIWTAQRKHYGVKQLLFLAQPLRGKLDAIKIFSVVGIAMRPCYLYNGNPYTGRMAYFYWDSLLSTIESHHDTIIFFPNQ